MTYSLRYPKITIIKWFTAYILRTSKLKGPHIHIINFEGRDEKGIRISGNLHLEFLN